jgi:hypothetical protein
MTALDSQIISWVLRGDTGRSSLTMAAHLTGREPRYNGMNWPLDPDDFGRCARLLLAVPALRKRLPRMRSLHPVWAALVDRWDDITACMQNECGLDWAKARSAPLTYDFMQSIMDPVLAAHKGEPA